MKTSILVASLFFLTGCAAPKVFVDSYEDLHRTVPAEEVDVLHDSSEAAQSYRVIAHLSVVGHEPAYPSYRGRTKIMDTLRARAGALGADAIVVVQDHGVGGEPVQYTGLEALETRMEGPGSASEGLVVARVHTIKAMAIVYESGQAN